MQKKLSSLKTGQASATLDHSFSRDVAVTVWNQTWLPLFWKHPRHCTAHIIKIPELEIFLTLQHGLLLNTTANFVRMAF